MPRLEHGEGRIVVARKATHVHGVGDDEALEAELMTQHVEHDGRRERGRTLRDGVECRCGEVPDHHAADTLGDESAEGHEVDLFELVECARDGCELVVAVERGAAVAGEVLGHGENAAFVEPARERRRVARDAVRVVAEGTRGDDRVRGRGVHVDNRRKDDVDAHLTRFNRGEQPRFACRVDVSTGRDRHGWRQRRALLDVLTAATLEIAGDEHVCRCAQLQRGDQRLDTLHVLAEDDDAARREALDERHEFVETRDPA